TQQRTGLAMAFHTKMNRLKNKGISGGGSVTIPCFYNDRYKTNVKYWCKWSSCPPILCTDSPQEGKVSIRDDPDQRVFAVTINNLTAGDSDYYSCGVRISGRSDARASLHLSVIDGKMSVLHTVANEMHSMVYRSAQFVNSDCRLVIATLKIQLRSSRLPPTVLGERGWT
uniref:Immunoglobulin domain-containing protein n=1 Tax=Paramormyrops kingsleyae TaxID=1676925 RepID=A0A3B3QWT8_9TELE